MKKLPLKNCNTILYQIIHNKKIVYIGITKRKLQ